MLQFNLVNIDPVCNAYIATEHPRNKRKVKDWCAAPRGSHNRELKFSDKTEPVVSKCHDMELDYRDNSTCKAAVFLWVLIQSFYARGREGKKFEGLCIVTSVSNAVFLSPVVHDCIA